MNKHIIILIVIQLLLTSCAGGNVDMDVFPPSLSYNISLGQIIENIKEATKKPQANNPSKLQHIARITENKEYVSLINKSKGENMPKCIDTINKAINLNPQCPDAYIVKGDLLAKYGKNKQARKSYEFALELDPTNIEAQKRLQYSPK